MAGPLRVRVGGGGIGGISKSSAPSHTPFVLGSRPPALRSPRIKPAIGVTQYAKQLNSGSGVPSQAGVGFGDTGKTGES